MHSNQDCCPYQGQTLIRMLFRTVPNYREALSNVPHVQVLYILVSRPIEAKRREESLYDDG